MSIAEARPHMTLNVFFASGSLGVAAAFPQNTWCGGAATDLNMMLSTISKTLAPLSNLLMTSKGKPAETSRNTCLEVCCYTSPSRRHDAIASQGGTLPKFWYGRADQVYDAGAASFLERWRLLQ